MAGRSLQVIDVDEVTTAPKKRKAISRRTRKTTKATSKKVTKKTATNKAKKVTDAKLVKQKKKPAAKKKAVKKTAQKKVAKKTTKKVARKKATVKKTVARKKAKKTVAKKKATPQTKTVKKKTPVKKEAKKVIPPLRSLKLPGTPKAKRKRLPAPTRKQPLGHLLVEKLLREAGFSGVVSTNKHVLEKYSTDESIFSIRPQIVLQPRGQRDVERAVRVLGEQTKKFPILSLTPRAAGTGLSGGSLTDSIVMDVSKFMVAIDEPVTHKKETTITCEPGAMWLDVETILKKKGVYLPSYPASKDLCTIGGAVANNAAGPNSLKYGHTASWIASLNVTLYDGNTYTLKPITYKEYKKLIEKDNAHARILREVFELIEKNEKAVTHNKPKTKKNSAGYAIWDVLSGSVASFKRGKATLDLTQLVAGSQGTIGVITSVTLKTAPIENNTKLIVVPAFNPADAGRVIEKALQYDPLNIELFDGLSFDLALQNPTFFIQRMTRTQYCQVLLSMYTMYHVRFVRQIPEFILLITLDGDKLKNRKIDAIVRGLRSACGHGAREVKNSAEKEMFWQIRRGSYSLSKFQDTKKRPAAFLEDMTVPPENFSKFFVEIKKLLKQFNIRAAIHGHGGNGHLHFYPLLDFTQKGTLQLVEKMSKEFFDVAIKYGGSLCGEHNDGIIRTPHLSKMFDAKTITLFEKIEHIFDPDDIFNPGKKVHPRFDIKDTLRKTN